MTFRKGEWDTSFAAGRDYNPLNEVLLDGILKVISVDQKMALDLGCGTGDTAVKFAKRGFNALGVDWSINALNKAMRRSEEANVSALTQFIENDLDDIQKIDVKAKTMDIVISKLVIAFVNDKRNFLTKIKSLLSDNGAFILITPVLYEGYIYTQEDKPNIAVNYLEISLLLKEIFSDIKEFNHSYFGERGDLVTYILK